MTYFLNSYIVINHSNIIVGYIDHFFVSKAYARQGVGTLLMNRIHEEAG
ncbi:GNAT family N-acetyltransferase [Yersinia aleksiciae]|nr:GNAT family N-acetyltransferase [Yersinia aleksiciae]MDN0122024.1 GNAT family N-acetyltransferase [Yersinia aleksiciae]